MDRTAKKFWHYSPHLRGWAKGYSQLGGGKLSTTHGRHEGLSNEETAGRHRQIVAAIREYERDDREYNAIKTVADRFGLSHQTVVGICKRFKIGMSRKWSLYSESERKRTRRGTTQDDAFSVLAMARRGMSTAEICAELNLSKSQVNRIIANARKKGLLSREERRTRLMRRKIDRIDVVLDVIAKAYDGKGPSQIGIEMGLDQSWVSKILNMAKKKRVI